MTTPGWRDATALIAGAGDCLEEPKQVMAKATTKETRVTIFSTLERELWFGFPLKRLGINRGVKMYPM